MSFEKYIDTMPYKKTAIITGNIAVICRKNVDTGIIHSVKMDADAWIKFYMSEINDEQILINEGLTKIEINFISKNIIYRETPKPKYIKSTKKSRK